MGFVDMRERYIIMHEGSLLVLNSFIVFITRSEMHVCCFIAASQSLSSWCRFIVKTRQGVEWWLFEDLRIVHRMSSVTEQLRYQLPNKLNTQTDYLRRLHFARSWCTLTLSSALNPPGLLGEGGENCRWSHLVVCTDFHDRKIGSECRLVYNLIFCWYILRLWVLCCAVLAYFVEFFLLAPDV